MTAEGFCVTLSHCDTTTPTKPTGRRIPNPPPCPGSSAQAENPHHPLGLLEADFRRMEEHTDGRAEIVKLPTGLSENDW